MNPVLWFDPCELILCSQLQVLKAGLCQGLVKLKLRTCHESHLHFAPPVMFACLDPACRKLLAVRPNAAASVLQAIDHNS